VIDRNYPEKLRHRLDELEQELSKPEVASNQKRMKPLLSEHRHLKQRHQLSQALLDVRDELEEARSLLEDPELAEMAQMEVDELQEKLPQLEKDLRAALLPPDPVDERGIMLEIRAGTGGDEAALFAGDLFRMYQRHAETRGWTCKLMESHASDLGGYKELIAAVQGEDVYRFLKYESGVHRVQRIPATETQGRIHTSAATVAVLPEAEEMDDLHIPQDDLRIDIYRASGAGGQHVNTTDSAVRITHLPSGLVVQCQDERSQNRNREKAMKVLQTRLLDHIRRKEEAKRAGERKSLVGSGDRSERIRTYNFPQNRITDHRINLTVYALDRVMEGDLKLLAEPLREQDIEDQLGEQLDVLGTD